MKTIIILVFILTVLFYTNSCRKDKDDISSNPKSNSNIPVVTSPFPSPETNDVIIDFDLCVPERKGVAVDFGTTVYEVVGKTEKGCLMKYGGEVENPIWDGFLDKICIIPISLGKQKFSRTSDGLNFSSLMPYCQTVSRPKK